MKTLKESILSRSSHNGTEAVTHVIEEWLNNHRIKKYKIKNDYKIDVNGDVNLIKYTFEEFPDYIQFDIVKGTFYCPIGALISLRGCPREVRKNFDCSGNKLTSLEGAPEKVWYKFDCSSNKLTSLDGCPEVYGEFSCNHNELTSLKGTPEVIKDNFYCYYNKLTSLVGGPKEVRGRFLCDHNERTSLEGAPKEVWGAFRCSDNKVQFTEDDVKKACEVKGEIIV